MNDNSYNRSGSISNLAQGLIQFQSVQVAITRDAQGYNYKYSSLANIWDAIRKPLTDCGLGVIQITKTSEDGNPIIVTILIHESGEYIEGELTLRPAKDDSQALGSALTYGRRYALLAICGLASEDTEDDGVAASGPKKKPTKRRNPTNNQKPLAPKGWIKKYEEQVQAAIDDGVQPDKLIKLAKHPTENQVLDAVNALGEIWKAK